MKEPSGKATSMQLLEAWSISEYSIQWRAAQRRALDMLCEHYKPRRTLLLGDASLMSTDAVVCGAHSAHWMHQHADVVASPDELPFSNGHFDLLVCSHWVESVENPDIFIAECARVIEPEGVVVWIMTNPTGSCCWPAADTRYTRRKGWWRRPLWSQRVWDSIELERHASLWGLQRVYSQFMATGQINNSLYWTIAPWLPMYKLVMRKREWAELSLQSELQWARGCVQ